MKKSLAVLFVSLSTFLISETTNLEVRDENKLQVLSQALQSRQTAKMRLENGLEIYIVSDPQADKSAAAMAINYGSWSDPVEYPGMAHFCEHMLFMGTEAYPVENGFFQTIMDQGGTLNAYTASDRTVYMFSTTNTSFKNTLDEWSHFFKDPLFLASGVQRELHAVDQEHDKNVENDSWREYMIFNDTGNLDHPNSIYSCGTGETLSKIPLPALRKWYETHYVANKAHLILYSPLPLDELKTLAVNNFSGMSSSETAPVIAYSSVSSEKQKGAMIYIKPVRDLRQITINWELPKEFSNDLESHSSSLLAYALNSKSDNSLYHVLKEAGLAEETHVSHDSLSQDHTLMQIQVGLTHQGVEQIDTVIEKCFQALATIKQHGIPEYLYDEMFTMRKLDYEYQSREEAFSFVQQNAHRMVDEALETYPQKTLLPAKYNPERLKALVHALSPENALYIVIAPPELTGVVPEQKEKWLGGEYTLKSVEQSKLATWSQIESTSEIGIPSKNPFIPSSLALLETTEFDHPQAIVQDEYGTIYFQPDHHYKTPEVALIFNFSSPEIDGSAQKTAFMDMYTSVLTDRLSSFSSYARRAGLHPHFSTNDMQFTVSISGYSQKAPELMNVILYSLKSAIPTKAQFALHKADLKSSYENRKKEMPFFQANQLMANVLTNDNPTTDELLDALSHLNYDDFIDRVETLFSTAYTRGIMTGNIDQERTREIWRHVKNTLGYTPYPPAEQTKREVLTLPQQSGPFKIVKHTDMQGHALLLALQEGASDYEKRAAQLILGQSLRPNFFQTLRTEQQTAYLAKSWTSEMEGQLFQFLGVQSTTHRPDELLSRFELFLEGYAKDFQKKLPETRFEEIRAALIEDLKQPLPSLEDYAARLNRLAFTYHDLNRVNHMIEAFNNIDYPTFEKIAKDYLSRKNGKRLALLLDGTSPENKDFRYHTVSSEGIRDLGSYVSVDHP